MPAETLPPIAPPPRAAARRHDVLLRLFLPPDRFQGETILIDGTEHRHLATVLRMRAGQELVALDGCGNAFRAALVTVERASSIARVLEPVPVAAEPPVRLTVAQALGKGTKLEHVIRQGTEAGASAFMAVAADHSVKEIGAEAAAERTERWLTVAKSAAEQSGRGRIPTVQGPCALDRALDTSQPDSGLLLLHPEAPTSLARYLDKTPRASMMLVAVGPEGGWSAREQRIAADAGATPISLGPRTLRTETAALVAVSQILFHYERAAAVHED